MSFWQIIVSPNAESSARIEKVTLSTDNLIRLCLVSNSRTSIPGVGSPCILSATYNVVQCGVHSDGRHSRTWLRDRPQDTRLRWPDWPASGAWPIAQAKPTRPFRGWLTYFLFSVDQTTRIRHKAWMQNFRPELFVLTMVEASYKDVQEFPVKDHHSKQPPQVVAATITTRAVTSYPRTKEGVCTVNYFVLLIIKTYKKYYLGTVDSQLN